MKTHFARHGIPDQVVSDNGPQYTSHHFANCSRTWNFEHMESSPSHMQSNCMAESGVKTVKIIIKRAKESKSYVYPAILGRRNTPTQNTRNSPPSKSDESTYGDTSVHSDPSAGVETNIILWSASSLRDSKRQQPWYYN